MPLQPYFDKIYCINLATRKDRWELCEETFRKHQLTEVQRVEGVLATPEHIQAAGTMGLQPGDALYARKLAGRVGCLLSHLTALEDARRNGYPRILILEDDIQFSENMQQQFDTFREQLPDDWRLLYLGGNEKGKQHVVQPNIVQVAYMVMAHAVGIHHTLYDELITLLQACARPVDVYYAELQKKYPCYAVYPYLAWQRADWSDIEQRFRIYDFENTSDSLLTMLQCKTSD